MELSKDKLNILNDIFYSDISKLILKKINYFEIYKVTPYEFNNNNLNKFDQRNYLNTSLNTSSKTCLNTSLNTCLNTCLTCSSSNLCNECQEEDYDNCIGLTHIKCPSCENKTTYGVIIDYEEQHFSYECKYCKKYFMICRDCYDDFSGGNPMELKEHFTTNKINKSDNYKITELSGNDYKNTLMTDVKYIQYIKPIYFYDEKKFGDIIGPCGGYRPVWICNKHNKEFILSDK